MGIDQKYIKNLDTDIFDCGVCLLFSLNPLQCQNCDKIICDICSEILKKEKNECPFKCRRNEFKLKKLSASLLKIYNNFKVICKSCNIEILISKFMNHLYDCYNKNCFNFEYCSNNENFTIDNISFCSNNCLKFYEFKNLIKKSYNNIDIYNLIKEILNNKNENLFDYDNKKYEVKKNIIYHISKENEFNTFLLNSPVNKKISIYEINIIRNNGSLKFGIVKNLEFIRNKSFSDYDFGYALMTNGQLRNNSGSFGEIFCDPIKTGKLKLIVNIFSKEIYYSYNGVFLGCAFNIKDLNLNDFKVAVACFGDLEFSLKETKEIPNQFLEEYFNESFIN